MSTWTNVKPTAPGYYWLRDGEHAPQVVLVYRGSEFFGCAVYVPGLTDQIRPSAAAQWCGPITPPEAQ